MRIVPVMPDAFDAGQTAQALGSLLRQETRSRRAPLIFWYYTPMMLGFSEQVRCDLVVYDCIDELADLALAPGDIAEREARLLQRADLALCGGRSLYAARRAQRPDVLCLPSGVDTAHFAADPATTPDPADQASLSRLRLGFYGVIDERMCLADTSWDGIASRIAGHIDDSMTARQVTRIASRRPVARRHYDVLVVGAGFAGAVMAERLASASGKSVLVIDKRDHIGGNAHDYRDEAGILVHKYGAHIFHTNSGDILDYLSRFTGWIPYEHRVLAEIDGQQVPVPINRTTLNQLYGLDLKDEAEAEAYLASVAVDLGEDPSQLGKSVAARVPARTSADDRYFTDRFQCMPDKGYTAMFRNILDHPSIDVMTGQGYEDLPIDISWDHVVWSGPIDEYFHHRLGRLPYRSLRFEHETLDCEQAQAVAVVNYPDDATPYTRITEYKHLTGQQAAKTSITREYPADEGDPCYPIPSPAAQDMYRQYAKLAGECENVTFVGRLATYRYYDMDQIVGQALATWRRLDARWRLDALAGLGVVAAE